MTAISKTGNIDAGKGPKRCNRFSRQTFPMIYMADATITPYGPASGSGLADVAGAAGCAAG